MGFFSASPVTPTTAPSTFPDTVAPFGLFLSNQYNGTPAPGQQNLYGVPSFNPSDPIAQQAQQNLTIAPNKDLTTAWNSWQPWDGGTSWLANFITNGDSPNSQIQSQYNNMAQYGGTGGYPTDLMHTMAQQGGAGDYTTGLLHNMAQYGGTGGPGNQAMSNALQFGAPSAAGQGLSNMQQFGVASQGSGNPLSAMAYGQANPMLSYMQQFMAPKSRTYGNAVAYQPPTLPGMPTYGSYQAPSIQG